MHFVKIKNKRIYGEFLLRIHRFNQLDECISNVQTDETYDTVKSFQVYICNKM